MTQAGDGQEAASGGSGVDPRLRRHGKVSYLEIPAPDPGRLADFYERLFGWKLERRDTHVSFDDGTGELIGRFDPGRAVSREPGFLPYVYVDDVHATVRDVVAAGAEVVTPVYPEGGLLVATFRDPAGNLIGAWQEEAR
jgi:predicted enzyme related to lactoylglutathione lyase